MRQVTVVVGFRDYTWGNHHVEVAEDPNYVLDDDEVKEAAVTIARKEFSSKEVSFFLVTYIEPLDDMEGLV